MLPGTVAQAPNSTHDQVCDVAACPLNSTLVERADASGQPLQLRNQQRSCSCDEGFVSSYIRGVQVKSPCGAQYTRAQCEELLRAVIWSSRRKEWLGTGERQRYLCRHVAVGAGLCGRGSKRQSWNLRESIFTCASNVGLAVATAPGSWRKDVCCLTHTTLMICSRSFHGAQEYPISASCWVAEYKGGTVKVKRKHKSMLRVHKTRARNLSV